MQPLGKQSCIFCDCSDARERGEKYLVPPKWIDFPPLGEGLEEKGMSAHSAKMADLEQMKNDLTQQNHALEATLDRRTSTTPSVQPAQVSLHTGTALGEQDRIRSSGRRRGPDTAPGSWLEAQHLRESLLVEPGNVKALASDRGVQTALLRSVWFPRGAAVELNLLCVGFDLAVILIALVTYRVYCGTSLYTVVAMAVSQLGFRFGKGAVLASARQKASPCLKPLALATGFKEQLETVRAQGLMQLFPAPIERPRKGALKLCSLGQHILFLAGGWNFVPWWAWAVQLLSALNDAFRQSIGYGNVSSGTTDVFLRCCDAAIVCLQELPVFHYREAKLVDWHATYKNYDALCDFIDKFGRGWRIYFFVVEFVSVPCVCLATLGLIQDVNALRSPKSTVTPFVLRVASVALDITMIYFLVFLIVGLWVRVSLVTAACGEARNRGIEAISSSASLHPSTAYNCDDHLRAEDAEGSEHIGVRYLHRRMDVDLERDRARDFVAYADLRSPGFSCAGVTISFQLGMFLAYPIAMVFATVVFPFAAGTDRNSSSALDDL